MKKTIFYITLLTSCLYSCNSTSQVVIDKSNSDLNYIFANIYWNEVFAKELSSNQIKIFKQANPKNTPENYFDGTGEVLFDLLVSIVNTGEYSESKLYIIKELNNPEVKNITEDLTKNQIILLLNYKDKDGNLKSKKLEFSLVN